MKKLISLFLIFLAANFIYSQSTAKTLKWLNKNSKHMTNIIGNGDVTVYAADIEFLADKIHVYNKERKVDMYWPKLNELIVTTYPGGSKSLSIQSSDNQRISFSCPENCDDIAIKIGQTSVDFGGKPEMYTRDMSKITSEDLFGK